EPAEPQLPDREFELGDGALALMGIHPGEADEARSLRPAEGGEVAISDLEAEGRFRIPRLDDDGACVEPLVEPEISGQRAGTGRRGGTGRLVRLLLARPVDAPVVLEMGRLASELGQWRIAGKIDDHLNATGSRPGRSCRGADRRPWAAGISSRSSPRQSKESCH